MEKDNRKVQVGIRVTPEEKKEMEQYAALEMRDVSKYLRWLHSENVKAYKAGTPVDYLAEDELTGG